MKQSDRVTWDWLGWLAKVARIWHCQPWEQMPVSARANLLNRYFLLVSLIVLTLSYSPTAQAETAQVGPNLDSANELLTAAPEMPDRLVIPTAAVAAPVGFADPSELPPPPAFAEPTPSAAPIAEAPPVPVMPEPAAAALLQSVKTEAASKPVELAFSLAPVAASVEPVAASIEPVADPPAPALVIPADTGAAAALDNLFQGNSDSLVAKAVGSAEGTRTPKGDRNPAYYGHVDPGNKAWNLGSFSYQHSASSPEDADTKQLDRLQDQAAVLQSKATARGMTLTIEEALNGIDLANQAPKAALDQDGYVDWLDQAHESGLAGDDAVLWARTQSFLDPHTQQWNAPGLGNTETSISRDQERRMQAIDQAIAVHQQTAQPVNQVAQASLHKIAEDVGIARLFAEQVVSHFGNSAVPTKTTAQPWTAPGLVPDSANVTEAESLSIQELFNLDLPAS